MGRFRPGVLILLVFACLSAKAGTAAAEEPPITAQGAEGDYLREMHRSIHFRWATRFIKGVAEQRPPTDPVNRAKEAEVLFVVRWDGSPGEITVSRSSGVPEFDAAAVAAIKGDARYPVPPIDVYGDDGVAHFQWVFARDARLCSGGKVRRLEAPLADALPRLFVQGRIKEALLRAARYTRAGDANAMSTFARAWLSRRFSDPAQDARAAAALAHAGDERQADRLKPALERPETADIAAPALASIHVDLCGLVRARLESGKPDGITSATRILRASQAELPADSPCVAALGNLTKNDALAGAVRADALRTLAQVNPQAAHRPALNALGDKDAQVRAAGAAAFARPGGGRPALYRLEPLLKDGAVQVRAAAAGGLVRACGDLADDYLAPVLKARDPEPIAAMVPELGKMTTPASLELLQKIAKRNEPDLRVPLLAAMAQRRDAPARAVYQTMAKAVKDDPYALPAARQIVYANADVAELQPLMKDPVAGLLGFKALLHAQRDAEAMDWLIASFDRLPPETLIDAFGAWLATSPTQAASK